MLRSISGAAAIGVAISLIGGAGVAEAQNKKKKSIIEIESMGARTYAGTKVRWESDPTNFLACDHGYVEWQIPPQARKHPFVLTHGAGIRSYMTTWDGQPGFQTIFLKKRWPLYMVDHPRTGRAELPCEQFVNDAPTRNGYSAKFVINNRVGVWPAGKESPEWFPGVKLSAKFPPTPEAVNQYLRVQYTEFNGAEPEERESDALAVLMDEIRKDHGKGIIFTHSSGAARGWLTALRTKNVGGIVTFEPGFGLFPEGDLPPPMLRADGQIITYTGRTVPESEFMKLTKFPILVAYGDNIPRSLLPENVGDRLSLDSRRIAREQFRHFVRKINQRGGNATFLDLPKVGIKGNTHYPMNDANVEDVAGQVEKWLRKVGLDTK